MRKRCLKRKESHTYLKNSGRGISRFKGSEANACLTQALNSKMDCLMDGERKKERILGDRLEGLAHFT